MLTTPTPAMEKVTVMGRVVKTIKGKDYLYEQRRVGDKIEMKYIGSLDKIIDVYVKFLDQPSSQEGWRVRWDSNPGPVAPKGTFSAKVPSKITTLMKADLASFHEWLLNQRSLDAVTAKKYLSLVGNQVFPITPEFFIKGVSTWKVKSFRLYVHFLYQTGVLSMEDKMRWLELLKIKNATGTKEYAVPESEVVKLLTANMPEHYRPVLFVSYYSGCRITEAARLLYAMPECEEFDSFRRYNLDWERGKKKSSYVYLPSSLKLIKQDADAEQLVNYLRKIHPELLHAKMLRKFFYRIAKATALEERADPALADFFEGRVPKTIGERHYGDMLAEADKLYPKILSKLSAIISPSCS